MNRPAACEAGAEDNLTSAAAVPLAAGENREREDLPQVLEAGGRALAAIALLFGDADMEVFERPHRRGDSGHAGPAVDHPQGRDVPVDRRRRQAELGRREAGRPLVGGGDDDATALW
jgi:hypothetical protein